MKHFLCVLWVLGLTAFAMQETPRGNTLIVMLGTGTPNAEPDRSGPSVAVVVGDSAYLVDCGPGVVRRAAAAAAKGVRALAVHKLNRLFITHLHSDHTLGYPDLILTPWVLERSEPLEVYGPRGVASMTANLLEAYKEDIAVRLDGSQPANKTGYRVNVHEIEPGVVYRDSNVAVTAFPVNHGSWPLAYGYRFQTPDRNIVISGDTAPSAGVIAHCAGCDVLVHEVYSQKGFLQRPKEWQRYHAAAHTSSRELAEIANKTKPGLLILYHQLHWGVTDEELVAEVCRTYSGRVVSARDLDIY